MLYLLTMSLSFRSACWSDVSALGLLYAKAFFDNPLYHEIFLLQGDTKLQALAWLFERRVSILLHCELPLIVAVADGNVDLPVAACGLALQKPGHWAMLCNGLLKWPFVWGVSSLIRALSFDSKLSNQCGDCELVMVAVHPDEQGKGVGTKMVKKLLEDYGSGLTISLSTQSEANVTFYKRFGFKNQIDRQTVTEEFTSWVMLRDSSEER